MSGIELIAAERQRQIEQEGWTPKHDDEHTNGELALAACCYASPDRLKVERVVDVSNPRYNDMPQWAKRWIDPWPWDKKWDKRNKHDRIRQLQIAGALIAAEIDRLQREAMGGRG